MGTQRQSSETTPVEPFHRAEGMQIEGDEYSLQEDTEKDEEGGFKNCCKAFMKAAFSHIGLCGMVCLYSVAGGFIFQHLEQTNEKQECIKAMEKYVPMENKTVHDLWTLAKAYVPQVDI